MIVITGSSFSLYEYNDDATISGPGIGQYLSLSNDAFVVSRAGCSNTVALRKLEHFLETINVKASNSTFYWFVTDPVRCVGHNLKKLAGDNPTDLMLKTLDKSFKRADELAKQFNIKINLVGAECDLPEVHYPNLNVVVKSWGQLLEHNWPVGLAYDIVLWSQKLTASADLVNILENINKKHNAMNQSKWFKSLHPTSDAHLKLAFALDSDFKKDYMTRWPDTVL